MRGPPLTATQLKTLADALTPAQPSGLGNFYFSLKVYARMNQGYIGVTELAAPATYKTIDQVAASWYDAEQKWTIHLEGGWTLRCIRARAILAGQ